MDEGNYSVALTMQHFIEISRKSDFLLTKQIRKAASYVIARVSPLNAFATVLSLTSSTL